MVLSFGWLAACESQPPSETPPGEVNTPTDSGPRDITPDGGAADTGPDDGRCVPSKAVWDRLTKGLFDKYCNKCHGETPNFGAPYSLVDYDDMIKGTPGSRKIDRVIARMANKTMPPAGSPLPKHTDLDTMTEWASCGLTHPDHSVGLSSSRDIFQAPDTPSSDWKSFDILAPKYEVGEKTLDLYQCFVVAAPIDQDRFIKRIETVIDESRVLHHIVLLLDKDGVYKDGDSFRCTGLPGSADYLYAWAPGANAIQFPDGGLRIKKGQRFVLQIHYNNGAGVKDVKDASGIRIHHAAPGGTEWGMISPGPISFSVGAGETKEVAGTCNIGSEMKVLAGMPHMHEIGTEFKQEIIRKDGKKEELIKLTGWSFESQFFYSHPITLQEGDSIKTTCTFKNASSSTVRSGSATKDEMCFNFMYVSPPPQGRFCDGGVDPNQKDKPYQPGACAPSDSKVIPDVVSGAFKVGEPQETKGGTISEGVWILKGLALYLESAKTPVGTIDLEKSSMLAKGQLITKSGNEVVLDVNATFNLSLEGGLGFNRDVPISVAGTFKEDEKKAGTGVVTPSCGSNDPAPFDFEVQGDTFRLISTNSFSGLKLRTEFIFRKD